FSPGFAEGVRRWAGARRCRTLSVGYRNPWADIQWIEAAPTDFAHAMARARAVATNFFHGCVFAILNERPFTCEPSPYRANKIRDLMAVIDASRRITPAG